MKATRTKTKKGAASIYIVIFTTTLLGIIALGFVRIMIAESARNSNYSLSQSAYNSALAGIEDAKIVLLNYQSCLNGGKSSDKCKKIEDYFKKKDNALEAAKSCDIVGNILHGDAFEGTNEVPIIAGDAYSDNAVDQAYTCVKLSMYTEDFLATLNSKNPTKLIPLRSEDQDSQNSINRIQIQWFDDQNYRDVTNGDGNEIKSNYTGFWKEGGKSDLEGSLTSNVGSYANDVVDYSESNTFTENSLVPPVIQATVIQTGLKFTMDQFYSRDGDNTNRGTLMLRPTSSDDVKTALKIDDKNNHSNVLPKNALAYSANKSFNTPIDVKCSPGDASWGSYACSADITIPKPVGGGDRNPSTSFLVLNLPYGGPQTNFSVRMFSCQNVDSPINDSTNCSIVYFAGVQPMVDSTGRANDLFRRVESRIELVDTNFPIANYALAMTNPKNKEGIVKDFYVTTGCQYSSSELTADGKIKYTPEGGEGLASCPDAGKNNSSTPGKGNGEQGN